MGDRYSPRRKGRRREEIWMTAFGKLLIGILMYSSMYQYVFLGELVNQIEG